MKLSVIMPVYNEKSTIEKILSKVIAAYPEDKEIIVVDDFSKDGTREVLKSLEKKYSDVTFIYKKKNGGKGETVDIGIKASHGDYVIVQDADLEYDPAEYKKLLRALQEEKADVIYGSRFSGNYEQMSTAHYFGNKVLTLATNILYGVMLTDMETCYKLIPGPFARKINIRSKRFDFEPEITAKILKARLKIKEVPISYKGRSFSEGKKITWRDGFAAVFTLLKFRFLD